MARKRSTAAKKKAPARSGKRAAASRKRAPSVAERIPTPEAEETKAAAKRHAEGLIERGEAVPEGQPLPPGATHEIVGKDADGTPIVKRRRFSAN